MTHYDRAKIALSLSALLFCFSVFHSPAFSQNAAPLVGEVTAFEPHSLLGKWNGHIKKFGRHPKLVIDSCGDGQVTGTYKGIFGRFPVHGKYDDESGAITLIVDFSKSKLTRLKRLKSGTGIIEARVSGNQLIGVATIQDLDSRQVRWEATKDSPSN